MRKTLVVLSLFLLGGCMTPLQRLKEINPSANDFDSSLASEYLAYADSESEQGRKLIAEHYANKGLKALRGEPEPPEPVDVSLPKSERERLAQGRSRLEGFLTEDIKRVAPQKLARAQLLFDCWQHELTRHLSQEQAPCAEEFRATMADLQDVEDSFLYTQETSYTLSFAVASAQLTPDDQDIIKKIRQAAAQAGRYAVIIEAPDGMGSRQQKLFAKRLTAVHRALLKVGIGPNHLRIRHEETSKKVHLSCDVTPEESAVTVLLKTPGPKEE